MSNDWFCIHHFEDLKTLSPLVLNFYLDMDILVTSLSFGKWGKSTIHNLLIIVIFSDLKKKVLYLPKVSQSDLLGHLPSMNTSECNGSLSLSKEKHGYRFNV